MTDKKPVPLTTEKIAELLGLGRRLRHQLEARLAPMRTPTKDDLDARAK